MAMSEYSKPLLNIDNGYTCIPIAPAVDVEKQLYDALLALMKSETATNYMQAQRAIKAYEAKGRL